MVHENDRPSNGHMLQWPDLVSDKLLRRYQRFKADVKLKNSQVATALCPNTGSMLGCSESGMTVRLSRQNRAERKLKDAGR